MGEIGLGVFVGAIERKDELLFDLPPGNEIQAQHDRRGDIVDVHRALPEPARPVAIAGVDVAVPVRNKTPGAEGYHVHVPDGITSFSMIQLASDSGSAAALVFFLFDLLYVDGEDLSAQPLIERKTRLAGLLSDVPSSLH